MTKLNLSAITDTLQANPVTTTLTQPVDLAELRKQRREEARARKQARKAEKALKQLNDDSFMDRELDLEDKQALINRLHEIEAEIAIIYDEADVLSRRTGEYQSYRTSARPYGAGMVVEAMGAIATNSLYCSQSIKRDILDTYGLSEVVLTELVRSLGRQAYFNNEYKTLMPEQPFDYNNAVFYLEKMAEVLGVELDLSDFTETSYSNQFKVSRESAQSQYDNYVKAQEVRQATIQMP